MKILFLLIILTGFYINSTNAFSFQADSTKVNSDSLVIDSTKTIIDSSAVNKTKDVKKANETKSYSRQCRGTTKKGKRCKRTTNNSSGYCWQHE